jgi:hypothetical protein
MNRNTLYANDGTEIKRDGSIFTFYGGRSVSWFKTMQNAGRLTVWTRYFSFSVGRRQPKDDGWPD